MQEKKRGVMGGAALRGTLVLTTKLRRCRVSDVVFQGPSAGQRRRRTSKNGHLTSYLGGSSLIRVKLVPSSRWSHDATATSSTRPLPPAYYLHNTYLTAAQILLYIELSIAVLELVWGRAFSQAREGLFKVTQYGQRILWVG